MFTSVLIANRGEIACRIIRTARRLGMRCIAVCSDADAGARHVRLADEALRIGPAPAAESYLKIDALIEAARTSRADCIHPGYGFLAENPEFAEVCAAAGIAFVGPPPAAIRAMGLKDRAKALMQNANVPVVPGYHGGRQEAKFLKEKAYEIGYPLMIKPVAGGGGKGMRKVERHADFDAALESAMREAQAAFGDGQVLLERSITAPRHIEFQVFADAHGHAIHLNERDCSLQRRHQKIIEEASAPGMTPDLRASMGGAAVEAARAIGYVGAGTVEFIADGSAGLRADRFWFMEMNTRLQVEHPVTEAITGLDLVEWQFRIAAGEPLPLAQDEVPLNGHAIEARVYAEDPGRGFLPSTGRLVAFEPPQGQGIRVDAGVETGDMVTPFYDPMIAKIIVHRATRDEAVERLQQALAQTVVAGPRSNLAFLAALCATPEFRRGGLDTDFVDRNLASLTPQQAESDAAAAATGIARLIALDMMRLAGHDADAHWRSPWNATDGFQLSGERVVPVRALIEGTPVTASARFTADGVAVRIGDDEAAADARVIDVPDGVYVLRHGRQTIVRRYDVAESAAADRGSDGAVRAPMHGKVLALAAAVGRAVHKGQRVAVIEAMKMEHALTAPLDGVIAEVLVEPGQQVGEGAILLRIEARDGEGG